MVFKDITLRATVVMITFGIVTAWVYCKEVQPHAVETSVPPAGGISVNTGSAITTMTYDQYRRPKDDE